LRIVLDTNVAIAAMRSRSGASAEILKLVVRRRLTMLGTLSIALEYLDVCQRPTSYVGTPLSAADALAFAEDLVAQLEPIDVHFRWRPATADPGDDHMLEAAVNGNAEAIVTFNTRDFAAAVTQFGLRVMTPADILREMEQTDG
jgi:putative PIN family toxin of toxin-antitoxin system